MLEFKVGKIGLKIIISAVHTLDLIFLSLFGLIYFIGFALGKETSCEMLELKINRFIFSIICCIKKQYKIEKRYNISQMVFRNSLALENILNFVTLLDFLFLFSSSGSFSPNFVCKVKKHRTRLLAKKRALNFTKNWEPSMFLLPNFLLHKL